MLTYSSDEGVQVGVLMELHHRFKEDHKHFNEVALVDHANLVLAGDIALDEGVLQHISTVFQQKAAEGAALRQVDRVGQELQTSLFESVKRDSISLSEEIISRRHQLCKGDDSLPFSDVADAPDKFSVLSGHSTLCLIFLRVESSTPCMGTSFKFLNLCPLGLRQVVLNKVCEEIPGSRWFTFDKELAGHFVMVLKGCSQIILGLQPSEHFDLGVVIRPNFFLEKDVVADKLHVLLEVSLALDPVVHADLRDRVQDLGAHLFAEE